MNAPKLKLIAADFFERPVKLRLPFRFGVVTLTEAPQVFVRARVRLADGRESEGVSAEMLAPKWFDKSPDLTNEENFFQLRLSLAFAKLALMTAGPDTPFGLSAAVDQPLHESCAKVGLNGLVASFGLALIDRAIIDALGRLERVSAFTLVGENLLGLNAATAPDLSGFDFGKFLAALRPAPLDPGAPYRRSGRCAHLVGHQRQADRRRPPRKPGGGRRDLRTPLLQAQGRRRRSMPTSSA